MLLIGDTIVDIYTYGTALGISAETPTIVARKNKVTHSLGGAALVCPQSPRTGRCGRFYSPWWATTTNRRWSAAFRSAKADLIAFAEPAAGHHHQASLLGRRLQAVPAGQPRRPVYRRRRGDRLPAMVERRLNWAEAKGGHLRLPARIVTPEIVSFARLCRRAGKLGAVYIDSQISQAAGNHALYRGGGVMCLNLKEARSIDPAFTPAKGRLSPRCAARSIPTGSWSSWEKKERSCSTAPR